MTKEILSYKNIKRDLKKHFSVKLRDLLVVILIVPLANIIILNLILLFCNLEGSFKIVFSIIFCSICLLLVSYDLTKIIVGLISIKNDKFEIISDWVINKKEKIYGSRISSPKPYRIIFANNGTYKIPYGRNYDWSKLFAFSDKNIYEHTDIGDNFYLISIGTQNNIVAYNKKFFEFIE